MRTFAILAGVLLVSAAGCTTDYHLSDIPVSHPASPEAAQAPPYPESNVLMVVDEPVPEKYDFEQSGHKMSK